MLLLGVLGACSARAPSEQESGALARATEASPQPAAVATKPKGPSSQGTSTVEVAPAAPDSSANTTSDDASAPAGGVALRGRVILDGTPPERRVINMTKDPACIKLHGSATVLDESVMVEKGGGVRNVFVYVRRGAAKADYPLPKEPAVLSQDGCMYRPRVQGMRVGQTLRVINGDPLTHNVRSFPVRNRAFNFGQPPDSGARERVFDAPEREIEIQCDIHPWMHAYLFVMEHPYFAVTSADGTYAIEGVPPGKYTLAVWHEVFGKLDLPVTVADKDVGDLDFTFKP